MAQAVHSRLIPRRSSLSLTFFSFFFLFTAFSARAATIHVPGDYATIQGAINGSSGGDTVLVSSGTYVENIDFTGKAIRVMSENGPGSTTIDGGSPGNPDSASVVIFSNGEDSSSVLDGFTLCQRGWHQGSRVYARRRHILCALLTHYHQ